MAEEDQKQKLKEQAEELAKLKEKLGIEDLFEFNLLPGKTLEELQSQVSTGNRNFYSILVPLALGGFTFIAFLVNSVVLGANLQSWENSVVNLKQEMNNPNSELGQLKVRNGELVTKADYIADPVAANVDFNVIFDVTDAAFDGVRAAEATSYGRENNGRFFVNGVSSDENSPAEILLNFQQQDLVDDVRLDRVLYNTETREHQFTISFLITAIDSESVGNNVQQTGDQQVTNQSTTN